jgi:hypothetical protein
MNRKLASGVIVGMLVGAALAGWLRLPEARAQRAAAAKAAWEYKVGVFAYNPGERATDEARRVAYERALNATYAPEGWEPVGILLDRTTIQTIGGGVTTRDTTSFVAFRRPRR